MPYRSTNFQVKTSVPAALSRSFCETRAVEPKPSAGTVPLTMVGASLVLAKFVAASLESIVRSSSLPPATFLPFDGITNGSPDALCSASYGIDESAVTVISGTPVILKSALVVSFISFSIQEPDGYSRASWLLLHWA